MMRAPVIRRLARTSALRVGLRVIALGLLLLTPTWQAAAAPAASAGRQAQTRAYDPRALRLLDQMADAYTHLTRFDQETEFTTAFLPLVPVGDAGVGKAPAANSEPTPSAREGSEKTGSEKTGGDSEQKLDRRLRLSFAASNRLRLEIESKDSAGRTQTARWISDGKFFWTYDAEKNLYSKEKAPGKIQDFAHLSHLNSGCLELLMLMGINPFAHVEEQAETVRWVGTDTVQGSPVDVVALQSEMEALVTETRLYIGAEDHLLRRLVTEMTPKLPAAPRHSGVGSPLDELAADPQPSSGPPPAAQGAPGAAPVPGLPMKSRVSYENHLQFEPHFDAQTFAFAPPENAYYLTSPDPHRKLPTFKQRLAELAKAVKQQRKTSPPRTLRF